MDGADLTGTLRARRCKRIAEIAGIALVMLSCAGVGMYVAAFVILYPMIG